MFERLLGNFPAKSRRRLFAGVVLFSIVFLAGMMVATLSSKGLTFPELFMTGCFLLTLPWLAIGFWNAVLGLILMRFAADSASAVNPILQGHDKTQPIEESTAIVCCVRNEDTASVARNLDGMLSGLAQAGMSGQKLFALYLLSDSSDRDIVEEEESVFADLKNRWSGDFEVIYRRRTDNAGFKAGNIRDFCQCWGHLHEYMLVLDADSYMSCDAILKLLRLMQSNPRVGILQSLVVGLPTCSAFARIFQYGMRLGMRSYSIGSAWWQGDCGPYWGHNAVIRLRPFIEVCALPTLPGKGPLSGPVLSHDQIEATFMRRAGYEVRIVPEENGSYEENPTSLLEFIRRDLRWCQGNLQYFRFLREPGLKSVSRFQLWLAIMMFIGSPAWMLFMVTAAVTVAFFGGPEIMFDDTLITGTMSDEARVNVILGIDTINLRLGIATFMIIMAMVFAPKIATVIDILSRRELRKAFGGAKRIVVGIAMEIVFSALLAPVMAVAHSVFIGGLVFGRKLGWSGQQRKAQDISYRVAARQLWPQTLLGLLGCVFVFAYNSGAALFALPVILGLLVSVPFAVFSASSRFGQLLMRCGLWRIPEERDAPACLLPLNLAALSHSTDNPLEGIGSAPENPVIVPGE